MSNHSRIAPKNPRAIVGSDANTADASKPTPIPAKAKMHSMPTARPGDAMDAGARTAGPATASPVPNVIVLQEAMLLLGQLEGILLTCAQEQMVGPRNVSSELTGGVDKAFERLNILDEMVLTPALALQKRDLKTKLVKVIQYAQGTAAVSVHDALTSARSGKDIDAVFSSYVRVSKQLDELNGVDTSSEIDDFISNLRMGIKEHIERIDEQKRQGRWVNADAARDSALARWKSFDEVLARHLSEGAVDRGLSPVDVAMNKVKALTGNKEEKVAAIGRIRITLPLTAFDKFDDAIDDWIEKTPDWL